MAEDNIPVDIVAHRIETDYFSVYEEVSNLFAQGMNNLARIESLGDRLDTFMRRAERVREFKHIASTSYFLCTSFIDTFLSKTGRTSQRMLLA